MPNNPLKERFGLVRNMYIGRTPSTLGDLTHGSTHWPLTVIGRILCVTTSLENLTLLSLNQNALYLFEPNMPASLRYLALGLVHGPFRPQDLRKRPKLETFVSALTYMHDDGVKDVVCFPSLRSFRRLYDAAQNESLTNALLSIAANQAMCISQSASLERLEIVLCGCEPFARPANEATDDPRVVVMGDRRTWLDLLYDEYLFERQQFIDLQLSS